MQKKKEKRMRFGSKVDGTNVGYSGAANGAKNGGRGDEKEEGNPGSGRRQE